LKHLSTVLPLGGISEELPEPAEEEGAQVVDLMAALRESVEQTRKKSRRRAKKAS